jgi:type IV pilus assembly protein PilM
MSALEWFQGLLNDPPPEFAFEIAADGIAMARTRPQTAVQHAPLAPHAISPSPVRENILDPIAYAAGVRKLVPAAGRGRRTAALILPDNSLRLAVLEFEDFPDKEAERIALLRFRLRKTVPFDIDQAALAWHAQPGNRIVVAVAPAELVAHYEKPFRAAGLQPGFVSASSLGLIELVPQNGSLLIAYRAPGALSVLALENGALTLARSLELSPDLSDPLDEISSDLYPTLVYLEDQTDARPGKLILAGFGRQSAEAATRLSVELEIETETILEPHPGLAGYLRSLAPARKAAA